MTNEWVETTLGNIFSVKHGYAFKGDFFTDIPQKTILVTPGNFQIGGGFQDNKRKYYNGPVPKEYILQPGHIIVTMTDLSKESDTLGYGAVIPTDSNIWLHNQRIGLLEFNGAIPSSPKFIQYLLRSREYRSWVVGSATGTTVKHTSPSRIESFVTKLPPLTVQRRIADILGTLDDKIELNRRMNATLEEMARALFKSWFVDFEPVRAKAAGQPTGLPAHIDALFPDRLVDSALGEIPEGWGVGKVGDVATLVKDNKIPSEIPSQTAYIALEHMPRKSLALNQWSVSDNVESNKSAFNRNDILFGKLRPYFHKVGIAPVNGVCSTDILVIRSKNTKHYGFTVMHLSSDAMILHCTQSSDGTKMPRTNWSDIAKYNIVLPTNQIMIEFNNMFISFAQQIQSNIHQLIPLTDIRDTLLPKLLSGEVEVGDIHL